MWGTVVLMAIVTAVDPAQIGPVAFFLSRGRPLRRLGAYWIGGFGVSLIAGGVIVFTLGLGDIGKSSSIPPWVEVAVGVLALVVAVLAAGGFGGRIHDRVSSRRARDRPADGAPDAGGSRTGFDKLPRRLQQTLRSESPWLAWVYGVAYGLPGAYYLAALAAILKAGGGTAEQVGALLVFNVIAFAVAEIPLASFAVAPDQTLARLGQLSSWSSTHRRLIVSVLAGVVGVYLTFRGISES
jgi:Sap, sulfolipid-1-addressing protein